MFSHMMVGPSNDIARVEGASTTPPSRRDGRQAEARTDDKGRLSLRATMAAIFMVGKPIDGAPADRRQRLHDRLRL